MLSRPDLLLAEISMLAALPRLAPRERCDSTTSKR